MNAIRQELIDIIDVIEKGPQFGSFPGLYGEVIDIEPSIETIAMLNRAAMLIELANLSKPINYQLTDQNEYDFGCDHGMEMACRACPCPGVPDYVWNRVD